jgi:hypothetical protein
MLNQKYLSDNITGALPFPIKGALLDVAISFVLLFARI